MRAAIAEFAAGDSPVYAECGGFMYLTEAIIDVDGRSWPMAGIFPTRARMRKRLAKLGYIEVENCESEGWLAPGERARGHEFRYSVIDVMPETIPSRLRGAGGRLSECAPSSAAISISIFSLARRLRRKILVEDCSSRSNRNYK